LSVCIVLVVNPKGATCLDHVAGLLRWRRRSGAPSRVRVGIAHRNRNAHEWTQEEAREARRKAGGILLRSGHDRMIVDDIDELTSALDGLAIRLDAINVERPTPFARIMVVMRRALERVIAAIEWMDGKNSSWGRAAPECADGGAKEARCAVTVDRCASNRGRRGKGTQPPLEVVGVASGRGGSAYAEVILTVRGCRVEPCRVIVGISRNASEAECQAAIQARLRQHLDEHQAAETTHA
jgi:hypothetical protein